MKKSSAYVFPALLSLIFLASCAPISLNDHWRDVAMVNAMTPSEVVKYDELGPVQCETSGTDMNASEYCKQRVRSDAANLDATLVVIETTMVGSCSWDFENKTKCMQVQGRAYRLKPQQTKSL